MEKYKAIFLDTDKCLGCTNCMKKCPTQAIRVRNGKASINYDRCIGCGNCVRACPSHAITPKYDSFDILQNYKYNVALVPSCFYVQFQHIFDPEVILNSLKNIGFDYVYEVSRASDILSVLKREMFVIDEVNKPVISTVCPACVELILTRYQTLKGNLSYHLPPLALSAKLAREEAKRKCGLPDSSIGVFYLSPCPANVEAIKSGYYSQINELSGALSISEAVLRLNHIDKSDVVVTDHVKASSMGIAWSTSGGEASSIPQTTQLAADGIENVISILRELEDGKLDDIDFIELRACPSGCVGGVLNTINTFVAKSKIHALRKTIWLNKTNSSDTVDKPDSYYVIPWEWKTIDLYKLDSKLNVAMQKMADIEKILKALPRLDCGLCGSPNCRALAEDIVQGKGSIDMCLALKVKK